MLRSIYEKILGALRGGPRRKTPRRARPRRLAMESLESRKLLTTTTLTYNSISDGSFETPALPALYYQYLNPFSAGASTVSSPWSFTGDAGISANGSGLTSGNPNAPNGKQVAFIQGNASISQEVTLDAGVYDLSALASQRLIYSASNANNENISVWIDGTEVGIIAPATPVQVNNSSTYTVSYNTYETSNFTVTAGSHLVTLQGMSAANSTNTAFLDEVAITPVVDALVDGGFETPALAVNSYQSTPSSTAWQFSGSAGVARNGSDFTTNWVEAQNAPQGSQVAYLQNIGTPTAATAVAAASISQTVFLDADTYQVSFLAAQRAIYQSNYEEIDVKVVNDTTNSTQDIGTINPVNTLYGSYQTSAFLVTTAGKYTIEFIGSNPLGGDDTAFIDNVTLSANAVNDFSFEAPALNSSTYQQLSLPNAPASSWQYSGMAGVAHNGSGFTGLNPSAPDANQVAYIEGSGSSISQTVELVPGEYDISFMAAQRANNQGQTIEVEVNNVPEGLITPVGIGYSLYSSSAFTITAQTNTIKLIGTMSSSSSTALIDEVSLTPANDGIGDGGFQTPALPGTTYLQQPPGAPWNFTGTAGITTNAGSIAYGSANAPEGNQAAYITNTGSISQTAYLDVGTYNISFMAAERAVGQAANQLIEVLLDPGPNQQVIDYVTPSNLAANSNTTNSYDAYSLYQTSNFSFTAATAGAHTIEFLGLIQPSGSGLATALIDEVNMTLVENTFSDAGFESPVLPAETYATPNPITTAWTFTGAAGISNNLSGATSSATYGSIYAPDGSQVAYLQNNGSISQPVYFFDTGASTVGTYSISFYAAQRIGYNTQPQTIDVLVNGVQVASITPSITTNPNLNSSNTYYYIYSAYQTPNFSEPNGTYTVKFQGTTAATAFIDDVSITAGCAIGNGSFETPSLASKAYQVAPSTTTSQPWQFSAGNTGVSSNASPITYGNPAAPNGYQVAYIEGTGTISQSVYLAAGIYNISCMAAQRYHYQTQYQTIGVSVDGQGLDETVGTIDPNGPSASGNLYPTGTTFGSYSTSNFTITTPGMYTITFAGLNPTGGADNTALIDNVQLNV